VDWITPNESEAELLAGVKVTRGRFEIGGAARRTLFEIVLRTDARKCGIIWA
jgi:hypothetical protein